MIKVKFGNTLKKLHIIELIRNQYRFLSGDEKHDIEKLCSMFGCDEETLLEILIALDVEIFIDEK